MRVARAIGDRKDDGSRQAASALLLKIANDGSNALKVAAAQALAKNGVNQVAAFETLAGNTANFDDAELSDAIVAMAAEFEADDFDAAWKEICADDFGATLAKSDNLALAYMKIAELRRTAEAGKTRRYGRRNERRRAARRRSERALGNRQPRQPRPARPSARRRNGRRQSRLAAPRRPDPSAA